MSEVNYSKKVEKWCAQEIVCEGYREGNPFIDYNICAEFQSKSENVVVDGFYDGDGCYKVRFMPSFLETYSFKIHGNFSDREYSGEFVVVEAKKNNHGVVRVANKYHFAYEDGTTYYPIGTTCYVWELQDEQIQEQTLKQLKRSPFSKIRFCIFPKHYDYNFHNPIAFPYEGTPCDSSKITKENFSQYNGKAIGNAWNFKRFNPQYFKRIEDCIQKLQELSIEADLILFHPYDRWGFSLMDANEDELYLKYVIARFSAYRNVWWSLANEYDLMPQKSLSDWKRISDIICEKDVYSHLRSIHNCTKFYNYSLPWVTHCSIQRQDAYKCAEYVKVWREQYQKPVILDEMGYEGDIQHGWGNLSGKEMVRRFWEATCGGGYAVHGETYLSADNILWWSHGGKLKGSSPKRLKFLQEVLKDVPGLGLMPIQASWDEVAATIDDTLEGWSQVHKYYLFYYSFMRPSFREFYFDDHSTFEVEVIDTWNMTIEKVGSFKGKFTIQLPAREYMAIRLRMISDC